MNYSDIFGGYMSQPQQGGGLLGNFGGLVQRPSPFGGGQRFPQYGGNSRTAQMMNQYMGGLLSPRQSYMPPALQAPQRQMPQSYMPQQAYMPMQPVMPEFGVHYSAPTYGGV
jgi:hypothetical protein